MLYDYVNTTNGVNVNMRTKEVWSVGSFLFTRKVPNFQYLEEAGLLSFYTDREDCLNKIKYFLNNEKERESIAHKMNQYATSNFEYESKIRDLMDNIESNMSKK